MRTFATMTLQRNPSMSYAPDSIRSSVRLAPSTKARRPAWILCRNLDEFAVPDTGTLQRWAERGRIQPDDELFDPDREICLEAREIAELRTIFRKAARRRLVKAAAWLLAVGALLAVWVAPMLGALMLGAALAGPNLHERLT